jgi:hypothetical protein
VLNPEIAAELYVIRKAISYPKRGRPGRQELWRFGARWSQPNHGLTSLGRRTREFA